MAREGLRVLVVAKKCLTEEQYQDFEVSFYLFFYSLFLNKQSLKWFSQTFCDNAASHLPTPSARIVILQCLAVLLIKVAF